MENENIFLREERARDFSEIPAYNPYYTGNISSVIENYEMWKPLEQQYEEGPVDTGDGFFGTTANLWRQANLQGHTVNLDKKIQEYNSTEGGWLPELERAKQYLEYKQEMYDLQKSVDRNMNVWSQSQIQAAYNRINELKYLTNQIEYGDENTKGLREFSRENPYLRDVFYDTTKNALHDASKEGVLTTGNKTVIALQDFLFFDNPNIPETNTNLSQFLSYDPTVYFFGAPIKGPNQKQLDYFWNRKNTENNLQSQLDLVNINIGFAGAGEKEKRDDIIKKIWTLKKGNALFDPTLISEGFKHNWEYYNEEGISLSDLKSLVYSLPHLGSSYSEIGAMIGQMSVSYLTSLMGKAAITYGTGGVAPLMLATAETAANLQIQSYMRASETKSEMNSARNQRLLTAIDENDIPLDGIVEQYKPILKQKGFPVDQMTDQEIFNVALGGNMHVAESNSISQKQADTFNSLVDSSTKGMAVLEATNNALSIPDYLTGSAMFSYGGKLLKNAWGLSQMKKITPGMYASERVSENVVRNMGNITVKNPRLIQAAQDVVNDKILRAYNKAFKNPISRVATDRFLRHLANVGVKSGIGYFSEKNEEGVQAISSEEYQRGEYDNIDNYSLLNGAANAMRLSVEANLAYYGLHPDESLNTDKDLINAMKVGGFTGLFMSSVYSVPKSVSVGRQLLTDRKLRGLVSDRYADAERDNKVEQFMRANRKGTKFDQIRETLESLKRFKPDDVTDQMIDEDIQLAAEVSSWTRSNEIKRFAESLGIKKGTDEMIELVQNAVDVEHRMRDASQATSQSDRARIEFEDKTYNTPNQALDFLLGRQYASYVNRIRNKNKKLQFEVDKLVASRTEKEVENGIQNPRIDELNSQIKDPIDYQAFKKNALNQILAIRSHNLLKQLKEQAEKRKYDLAQLASDQKLDVNLDGISGISKYIDQMLEAEKPYMKALIDNARKQGVQGTDQEILDALTEQLPTIPEIETFDKLFTTSILNRASLNDLTNHFTAYVTGMYNGDMTRYTDTYENLTSEEIEELSVTPAEYNRMHADQQQQTLSEMDEAADREPELRRNAFRVIERDLRRRQAKVKDSREETAEEFGTEPVTQEDTNDQGDSKPDAATQDEGHSNKPQDELPAQPTTDSTTESNTDVETTTNSTSQVEDELAELENLTEEQPEINTEEVADEEESPNDNIRLREEAVNNTAGDLADEQDRIKATTESVEVSNDTTPPVDETATEDIQTPEQDNVQEETDEAPEEKDIQPATPEELENAISETPQKKTVVPPTDQPDIPNPLQKQPDATDFFVDPATDQLRFDPSGTGDFTNAITVDDSTLQMQESYDSQDDPTMEGPSAFQNRTANTDEINPTETKDKQKRRHIANTFFYQPLADEVMPIRTSNQPVEFITKDGKKAERRPGRELAEKLAQPGWINTIDDAYYVVTRSTHDMTSSQALDNLAIHLIIEKDGIVYNASLRAISDELRKELLNIGVPVEEVDSQIEKLRALRTQIINAYAPNYFTNPTLPTTALKHVKPVGLRISNGSLDNQIDKNGLPVYRSLTEVEDFGLSSDPQEMTDQLLTPDSDNGVELGYGKGPFAVDDPFSIVRIDQSEQTTAQGTGYAGKIYIIPKPNQTPSQRVTIPIMLAEETHRTQYSSANDVQLAFNADGTRNPGVSITTAELIFNLLTGVYGSILPDTHKFVLDLLANTGSKTGVGNLDKAGLNKFNFLVRKQLYTYDIRDNQGNFVKRWLVSARMRTPNMPQYGYETRYTDVSKLTNEQKKQIVWEISQNIHWNTDKELMLSEFPQYFIDGVITEFNKIKGQKDENTQIPILSRDLTFTLKDLGYTVDQNGKVIRKEGTRPIVLSWMINHKILKTDLGNHAFFAPFVYTDSVQIDQRTKDVQEVAQKKTTKVVTTSGKTISEKKPTKTTIDKSTQKELIHNQNRPTDKQDDLLKGNQFVAYGKSRLDGKIKVTTKQEAQLIIARRPDGSLIYFPTDERRITITKNREIFDPYIDFQAAAHGSIRMLTITPGIAKQNAQQGDLYDVVQKGLELPIHNQEELDNYYDHGSVYPRKKENDSTATSQKKPVVAKLATPELLAQYGLEIPVGQKLLPGEVWGIVPDKNTGKPRIIRAPKQFVEGLHSVVRGEGTFDRQTAVQWLVDKLGIDPTNVMVVNSIASTLSDGKIYGVMRAVADVLDNSLNPQFVFAEDAGRGIEYHEAFHYVTQLMLNRRERELLYQEYEKSHPTDSPRTKRQVEELLAEEFRNWMIDQNQTGLRYAVIKFFKNIASYIKHLFKQRSLQDALFNAIASGKFKNNKPEQSVLKEFYNTYNEGLYYYIPGLTKEEIEKIPSILDGNQFYKIVNSLTSTALAMYDIRSADDVERLDINSIFQAIQDRSDMGWFGEDVELLAHDVVNNKDIFKKYILRKLNALNIRQDDTLEAEEESRLQTETGDNPDNNWDKNQGEHSKKKNVAFNAKLFFYSLPKYEYQYVEQEDGTVTKEITPVVDDIFGLPITEDFNDVWNQIMENLWDIDNYNEMVRRVGELANTYELFYSLYQKLTDPNNPIPENTKTQLEVTVKSFKAKYDTINVHPDKPRRTRGMTQGELDAEVAAALGRSIWEVRDSDDLKNTSKLPKRWSNSFFSSNAITTNDDGKRTLNKNLVQYITNLQGKISHGITRIVKNKQLKNKETEFQTIKESFIELMNALSIPFDMRALDVMLEELPVSYVSSSSGMPQFDKFLAFWNNKYSGATHNAGIANILANIKTMSRNNTLSLSGRGGESRRTADRIFNYGQFDAAINVMARSYGKVHPSSQEFSVTGADGSLVYPISENNYVNDQVRNINKNTNGKLQQILDTPYSSRSLIANNAKAGRKIQLHSFLMMQVNNDEGRDYFGISPIEDYIAKVTLTMRDQMVLPTMSDKKTWYSISGIPLVHDLLLSKGISRSLEAEGESSVVGANRRYSNTTMKIMANMFLDEFDAVWDYYVHKSYVEAHPEERIDNYHGKIQDGKMSATGNGGRFRYFSSLIIDGKNWNINHRLANIEVDGTTEDIFTELKAIKTALFGSTDFTSIDQVAQNSEIYNSMNEFLLDATYRELEALRDLGIVYKNPNTGRFENRMLPYSIVNAYSSRVDNALYSSEEKALQNEDILYSIIGSHVANYMISITEFEKCISGDPAYYKHKTMTVTEESIVNPGKMIKVQIETERSIDKIKRLSSVLSTGTNLRTVWDNPEENNTNISVLTMTDNQIGSDYESTLRSFFRNQALRDQLSTLHPEYTDEQLIRALDTAEKENAFYNTLNEWQKKFVDKQVEDSVSPYTYARDEDGNIDKTKGGNINQSDAAVYIRPAMYMRIMKALGKWSPEIEEAYRIMEGEDESWMNDPVEYAKTMAALAQPLKMVYFGDHRHLKTNLNVPIFDKMAMFPLFKAFARADNRLLYKRMNNEQLGTIDMLVFESAVKVGGSNKWKPYLDSTNETFNVEDLNKPSYHKSGKGTDLPVYTQDIRNLRLQLNTDPHAHTDRAFGTQAIKICLSNLVDSRTYGLNKGQSILGSELKQQVIQAINTLTDKGRANIIKRFFRNHNINNQELSRYLVDQAMNSNMPDSFIDGLGLNENGEFKVPLEACSYRRWIESRLLSYVGKEAVDVNTPGGSAIQMSSFGFKATGPRTQSAIGYALNDGKKLSFLREDGNMEVILSTNFFRHIVPKEFQGSYGQMRKWLIEHNVIGTNSKPVGIGYRIPTQGLSSTFSFVVADVLPDRFGDTIVVPDEFTAMTGSDFDVDKLYIAMLNLDQNGEAIQFDSNKPFNKQSVEAIQNRLIQSYQIAISDNTNMAETRASIDTLTNILKGQIVPMIKPTVKQEALPAYELLPSFQLGRKDEYTSGKAGIAPFALNSTNHALTQFVHLRMRYSHNNCFNLGPLDAVKGRDGYRIMDWLSAMINAHVDVAREPYVFTLNINSVTYNMTNLLLRGGMGRATFLFLGQPAIKRYAQQIKNNSGVYMSRDIDEIRVLDELIKQYGGFESLSTEEINQVFNEEALIKALRDPNSEHARKQQRLVLIAYRMLYDDARRLNELVQRSQIDTKKYGNTIATQMNFRNSYDNFIEQNGSYFSIPGVEEDPLKPTRAIETYFNTTFLGKKLYAATVTPKEILRSQLLSATPIYEDIFKSVLGDILGYTTITDYNNGIYFNRLGYRHTSNGDFINKMAQYISAVIRTRLVRDIPQLNATDEELNNMFTGNNTMCKQLAGIKQYIRDHKDEFPDLVTQDGKIKNELLNYLQELPADNEETQLDRIVLTESSMNNDFDRDNQLVTAFADLLYHDDSIIREFANNLAKYAYLTSYDERGVNSFFGLVPNQWKQEVGYIDAIRHALGMFAKQNSEDAFNLIAEGEDNVAQQRFPSITTAIVRNMWNDNTVVSELEYYNDKRPGADGPGTKGGNERTLIFDKITVNGKQLRIPAVFMTPRFRTKGKQYIKVTFGQGATRTTELYRQVGEVGYGIDPENITAATRFVYQRMPKLGAVDGSFRVMELGKDGFEQSAFEQNAFAYDGSIDENTIQQEAFKNLPKLKNLEDGMEPQFLSAEAVLIKAKVKGEGKQVTDAIDAPDATATNNTEYYTDNPIPVTDPTVLAAMEQDAQSFVNISLDSQMQGIANEVDEALDIMNSIQATETLGLESQESIEIMDMSMPMEQPIVNNTVESNTNIAQPNVTDFQSIEAIDMSELVASGKKRKKECK